MPQGGSRSRERLNYGACALPRNQQENIITFKDHTARSPRKSAFGGKSKQPAPQIALPNPFFLRIQFAIARVLRVSGAGECIEEAIHRVESEGDSDFEKDPATIEEEIFRSFLLVGPEQLASI